MELLEYLRQQDLKWATIYIKIFDEDFFKDKDIDFILEETDYFHKTSIKFKYSALEYQSYKVYGLRINNQEFFEIETLKDLKKELKKSNRKK